MARRFAHSLEALDSRSETSSNSKREMAEAISLLLVPQADFGADYFNVGGIPGSR